MANYFQSFDLHPQFAIELGALEQRYEQLMRLCHPDRFAGSPAFEQQVAAKRSADINEAFDVLKHAVKRAGHLLELKGVDLDTLERQPASPDFLFDQMMFREQLQEFDSLSQTRADALVEQVGLAYSRTEAKFVEHFESGDITAASASWVEFHFQQKLKDELIRAQSQAGR